MYTVCTLAGKKGRRPGSGEKRRKDGNKEEIER